MCIFEVLYKVGSARENMIVKSVWYEKGFTKMNKVYFTKKIGFNFTINAQRNKVIEWNMVGQ